MTIEVRPSEKYYHQFRKAYNNILIMSVGDFELGDPKDYIYLFEPDTYQLYQEFISEQISKEREQKINDLLK